MMVVLLPREAFSFATRAWWRGDATRDVLMTHGNSVGYWLAVV
jgi:hypothetical protein